MTAAMSHYRHSDRPHSWSAADRRDALVGDGSTVTAEQFADLDAAGRDRLFQLNPDRYRQLQELGS